MKKLLGILGTITIAGSGISGIVGNVASSEIKSKINYSQTNNLENLNRTKRNNISIKNNLEKILGIYGNIGQLIVDSKGNVYFTNQYKPYILKTNETKSVLIEGISNVNKISIDLEDNLYFITGENNNNFYILKNKENKIKKVTISKISHINNIFFDKNNIIYYSTIKGIYKSNSIYDNNLIKINKINENIEKFVVFNNGIIAFIKDKKAYFLKPEEETAKYIDDINNKNINEIAYNNDTDDFYISTGYGIYLLKNNENNFKKINGINFNVWALFINKNNLFFGTHKYGAYVLKNNLKNQNKIINFNNLLNSAISLNYQDKYSNSIIKEIKNININNLNYKNNIDKINIQIDSSTPKPICFSTASILKNKTPLEQTLETLECSETNEESIIHETKTGLSNTKYNFHNVNFNLEGEYSAKVSLFVAEAKLRTRIMAGYSYTWGDTNTNHSEETNRTDVKTSKTTKIPSQKIKVSPNKTAEVRNYVNEGLYTANLDLKQEIKGTISSEILDNNNQSKYFIISIKEAMETLKKYNLLPEEIIINDDFIVFNGKTEIKVKDIIDYKVEVIEN